MRLPKDMDDAEQIIWGLMDDEMKKGLREVAYDDLLDMHFSFGMWIRNTLEFWTPPFTAEYDDQNAHLSINPDAVSAEITKRLWRRLQSKKEKEL